MEQINEEWRDIEGYEGLYQVSNLGRVRSLKWGKERILKPSNNKDGYFQVELYKEGKGKMFRVHRLVAQEFIPNPEGLNEINHKDEDKTNNVVFLKDDGSVDKYRSNLEWCDSKYNKIYGTRIERVVQTRIKNGTADPELCGIKTKDKKEYNRLRYLKKRNQILEQQREYRLKKKQSSKESLW